MSTQEQGKMRAALNRGYIMRTGGVEQWAKEREEKRRMGKSKAKRRNLKAAALARLNQPGGQA